MLLLGLAVAKPDILVGGDDDVENDTAGGNPRGGEGDRDVPIGQFIERLRAEVYAKETSPRVG